MSIILYIRYKKIFCSVRMYVCAHKEMKILLKNLRMFTYERIICIRIKGKVNI